MDSTDYGLDAHFRFEADVATAFPTLEQTGYDSLCVLFVRRRHSRSGRRATRSRCGRGAFNCSFDVAPDGCAFYP